MVNIEGRLPSILTEGMIPCSEDYLLQQLLLTNWNGTSIAQSPLGTYHFLCDSNRDYGGSPFSFVRSVLLSTHVKTALWLPSPSEKALSIVSSKKRDRAYIKGKALLSFQLIDQRAGNSSIQGRVSKVASSH